MKSLHNPQIPIRPAEATGRLFELAALLGDSIDRGLADQGLTRARAEVIWRLGRRGSMTQRELSEALRCTPRNVTGLVDALESEDLVTRGPHPTDRRATLVRLTRRGGRVASEWQAGYDELAKRLFAGLDDTDIAGFVETLDRVLDRLRDEDANSSG